MNWWPGFLVPELWPLFALVIPLIVLYFLKLKRPRVEIASLALWQQVISDQRVNSPFQKFKRNLLLLIQLLLLMLLILAAMQPFLSGGADHAKYMPILIDQSASMGATDADGKTRLDLAKEEVSEIIDDILPGQRISLIAVGSTGRRLTEFTDNQVVLRDALAKLEVIDVPSKLEDGLRMTQALARTAPIETVRLYSDGNLPTQPGLDGDPMAVVDFELPFKLDYRRLPAAVGNIGITAFNARRSGATQWDVFVRIESSVSQQTAAQVELTQDGQIVANEDVVLEKGESQRLVFSIDSEARAQLVVSLKPDGRDALTADNVAYLNLPVSRPLLVYCPVELASYRHALEAVEGIILYPDEDGDEGPGNYDLLISDDVQDAALTTATYLGVGVIPDELKELIVVEVSLAEVVDWKRDEKLLQHVQLSEVQISDLPKNKPGVGDGNFEELGYSILAFGNAGPLIVRKQERERLNYYLLFHTDRSTLPYRVGFPILVANMLQIAMDQASLAEVNGNATGVLPPLQVEAELDYDVTTPSGETASMKSDSNGQLVGIGADEVGKYTVKQGGQSVRSVGVSLLNQTETSLAGVDEIQFRELSVSKVDEQLSTDKPLWSKLAFAAFCLLLLEWWFFQHRPGGTTG